MSDIDWKIKDNSLALQAAVKRNSNLILTKWGLKWQEIATGITTRKGIVDTGLLRDTLSFKIDVSGQKTIVGSPQKYAIFNELGTSKMSARPFIVPAIKDNAGVYKKITIDSIKSIK